MKNPKVDAYIAQAEEFARPILCHLRELFHLACPEIEETLKWSVPHFGYKGMLGSMAAFKQHVSFGFWKGQLLSDPEGLLGGVGDTGMAMVKVTDVGELPPDDVLLAYIREAVDLNERGVVLPRKPAVKRSKEDLEVPADLRSGLAGNAAARATFDGFSYSQQKDYVDWLTEAKREATRANRLATTLEWLAEGKTRNWKYERKRG